MACWAWLQPHLCLLSYTVRMCVLAVYSATCCIRQRAVGHDCHTVMVPLYSVTKASGLCAVVSTQTSRKSGLWVCVCTQLYTHTHVPCSLHSGKSHPYCRICPAATRQKQDLAEETRHSRPSWLCAFIVFSPYSLYSLLSLFLSILSISLYSIYLYFLYLSILSLYFSLLSISI